MKKTGTFEGLAYHEWVVEGRRFRLLRDLVYTDSSGRRWFVPKGQVINRKKIPRCIRRWVADPFCAKMRRATAVMSYHATIRRFTSADVYRMFGEAMRTDGVPWRQRVLTIWGLRVFGGRWG